MTKDKLIELAQVGMGIHSPNTPEYVVCEALIKALAQPEQEPVAFINVEQRKLEWAKYMRWDTPTVVNLPKIPLYTTPPQRTWVGLTDEDFQPMVQKAMVYYGYDPEHSTLTSGAGFYALARAIEAKLKEKNT
jgi:hypothetical protein